MGEKKRRSARRKQRTATKNGDREVARLWFIFSVRYKFTERSILYYRVAGSTGVKILKFSASRNVGNQNMFTVPTAE